MKSFVSKLLANKLAEARDELEERIQELFHEKLDDLKEDLAITMFDEGLKASDTLKMGRTKLVRVRIRKGKLQRGRKFSTLPGFTYRDGKLVRIMPAEHRNRVVGSKESKSKRRSRSARASLKRNISLRKRRAMGL